MSPFKEYLKRAQEIREQYANLINNNPEEADKLKEEMKDILTKLLDDCEKKEFTAFKIYDNIKTNKHKDE